MADQPRPRELVARTEKLESLLQALEAVRDLRQYLTEVEKQALVLARERGASAEELASALGVTRQAVYYKLHHFASQASPAESADDVLEVPDLDVPSDAASRGRRP